METIKSQVVVVVVVIILRTRKQNIDKNKRPIMDFDDATARLARDQSKMKGRRKGGVTLSDKARKQAEFQKKQQARLREERERKKRIEDYQQQYMHKCERSLKEKSIGPAGTNLLLKPTSIYGDGDKISLPPSVLETMTSSSGRNDMMAGGGGNPWIFRIGVLNPEYKFPASPLIQNLVPPPEDEDVMDVDDDDDTDDEDHQPYLDELGHKYIAYTYCTVIEFTQEDGCVGIPHRIASCLLNPKNRHADIRHLEIPTTRTVDPASVSTAASIPDDEQNGDAIDESKGISVDMNNIVNDEDQTPGHFAYGRFDIPDVLVEVTMVNLPKGTGCTLTPSAEAVRNGFYGLKDVKLVLEQSLIRTRATLSTGDIVSTWHRGVDFDLEVTKVIPNSFHAVTCINTDIEVDIGETTVENDVTAEQHSTSPNPTEQTTDRGFRLGSSQTVSSTKASMPKSSPSKTSWTVGLPPEPPEDKKDGVCSIQIRYNGGQGKRRFAIETTQVKDLFAFASSLMSKDEQSFRLVTRFPRRELSMAGTNQGQQSLLEVGIRQGQEQFIVETIWVTLME
jgi:hypothetical protein